MSGKRVRNFAGSGSLESGCGCPSNATIASRRSSARFEISLMKVSLAVAALFGLLVQDTPQTTPTIQCLKKADLDSATEIHDSLSYRNSSPGPDNALGV